MHFAYELLFERLLHLVSKASETVFFLLYFVLFYFILFDTNIIQTIAETVSDETLLAFIRQKVVTSRTNTRNGRSSPSLFVWRCLRRKCSALLHCLFPLLSLEEFNFKGLRLNNTMLV